MLYRLGLVLWHFGAALALFGVGLAVYGLWSMASGINDGEGLAVAGASLMFVAVGPLAVCFVITGNFLKRPPLNRS